MKTGMYKKIFLTAAMLVAALCAVAMTPPESRSVLERALTLLEHRRWCDARHELLRAKETVSSDETSLLRQIEFGLVVCAVELKDADAEHSLLSFLANYPESVHVNDIHFLLGIYYCENEEFAKAREEFGKVSYKALTADDRERYDIRLGYAEFVGGNLDRAYEHFSKVSPTGQYADHATYYKSYIHYHRGEFDQAYNGFVSLKKSDAYSSVIPYYLLQLEFSRGNYDYVVRNGDDLLAGAVESQRLELMRILAESWYRLEGYNKALFYISMYRKNGGVMNREENYLLGYSAYRTTDYAAAIEALQKVCTGDDSLAQNASYHLADCYIKQGNKRLAIYSFAMAADDKFANEIAEDALFNYGKLLFETGGGTFNESINVLTRYVNKYPDSPRAKEARELLIAAYYNSHDYDMAYSAIKSFDKPDGNIKTALQKITCFKGMEALSAGDAEKAQTAFEESMAVGVSPKYNALCSFWLGEIAYNRGDYPKAIERYNFYLKRAPKSANEYKMALYNIGYSQFALGEMAKARKAFEGFLWLYKNPDSYRADAYNRLGDTQYSSRDFAAAVKSYESAAAIGSTEQYYAQYQRAVSLGLLGKTSAKIGILKQIVAEDRGDYADDASYELGRTYVSLEQYGSGASVLETFIGKYPASPYYMPALLDLGLIYFNLGDTARSLKYYDKVITAAPQSETAKDAMQSVREIYVGKGDVDSYFAYAERTGVECDLSSMTRDSLSFRAAQKIYLSGRTADAIPQLEHYIANYPKGYYLNDALFCLSDSYLKCDSLDSAVASLKLLAEKPTNQYTLAVLEKLSQVTFDNRMYDDAAAAYRRLYDAAASAPKRSDAASGYVKSVLAHGSGDSILAMANDIDSLSDVSPESRRAALFAKAGVLSSRNDRTAALDIYKALSAEPSSREGAESAYIVIRSIYDSGDLDECEKRIYAFADSKTSQSYWLGKAFVLLGDIYLDRNDQFQARATYQSIIDGYSPADDGIVDEAKDRIKKLN